MKGKLYLVSTPLGNLEDITIRALNVLRKVDIIACEDTRHAKKLLFRYGIKTATTSYFEHNEEEKSRTLVSSIKEGKDVAVISDAGTPAISDPGYKLVNLCIENEIEIISIPGPSSVIAALTSSGLPTDSFYFIGFLPRGRKKVTDLMNGIYEYSSTIIFFDSPRRIIKNLGFIHDSLGDRKAAVCREMTKLHEEVIRGTITQIIKKLEQRDSVKGEITVIMEGKKEVRSDKSEDDLEDICNRLKSLKKLGLSMKDSVKVVNEEFDIPKKKIYDVALTIWNK